MEEKAPHNLGVIFFPAFDWAIDETHPEREERLLYTHDLLREEGIFDLPGIKEYKTGCATRDDLKRVHFFPMGLEQVVGNAHLISAGGAIEAGKLVAEKKAKKAFAMVRPPGHHARKVVHGGRGFCNINNVAIMIEHLRAHYGYKKVAIVDTDCHHGDGTQDIYWFDPFTLYISIHQDGRSIFPGTGFIDELGAPNAWGKNINIPLHPMTGDEGFILAVKLVVLPLLKEFQPDLVVNSAGQDNHFSDPITDMYLTAAGYAEMVELIDADIAVLEGGYAIQSGLPYTNMAIILQMAGYDGKVSVEPSLTPELRKKIKTIPEELTRIKRMAEEIHKMRNFRPEPDELDMNYRRGFYERRRRLFYDTHPLDSGSSWPAHISEIRHEYLRDCSDCPGVVVIRTESDIIRDQIYVQLPFEPCEECLRIAKAIWEKTVPDFD
jgi:acetoin utilization deacetylase AcuC-like enzyme